jgi:hypothetical protein
MQKNKYIDLEIIFDNTESSIKYNKELIHYFKNNLDSLNHAGLRFVWRIAVKEEYPKYKERGIKHFPAVIMPPNQPYYGVKNIIKEISQFANRRNGAVAMASGAGEIANGMSAVSDEALYEYQRRTIGKAGDDENDMQNNMDSVLRRRQSEMIQRRQNAGLSSPVGTGAPLSSARQDTDYMVKLPDLREDNVTPMKMDPADSLQRLRQRGGADQADIDLMQMHLDKMDTSNNMDYF